MKVWAPGEWIMSAALVKEILLNVENSLLAIDAFNIRRTGCIYTLCGTHTYHSMLPLTP